MSRDEQVKPLIKDPFEFKSITEVNFKPHPFTIGPRHMDYASKHCHVLDEAAMRSAPCAARNCKLSYDDHTCDTVLFLSLTRNCTQDEAREALQPLTPTLEELHIDGVAFVETAEKFRIS